MTDELKTTGESSLTPEEYKKVLEAVEHPEDRILIMLAVDIGLRRKDISRVEVRNISVKDKEITYYEEKKDKWRTVPISKKMAQELQLYLNTLPKKRKYLFSFGKSKHGDKTAYNRFNRLLKKAGLNHPRPFHCLRSTCYKFCQRAGWSPAEAARLLGDSIRVAQEHYETPSKAELREKQEDKEIHPD